MDKSIRKTKRVKMICLKIGNLPQSYNKVVKFTGWQRQEYRDEWYDEVRAAFLVWRNEHSFPKNLPFKKAKIIFTIYFSDKRIRDHGNTISGLKFCLDALTVRGIGIIQDDQWYPKKLVDDYYIAKYDKKWPRVIIEIEEEINEQS